MTHSFHRVGLAPLAALFAIGISVGAVATAVTHDDPAPRVSTLDRDTAFVTFLNAKDVGTTSRAAAVEMGHKVVDAVKVEKVHPWIVGTRLVSLGYTGDEAATIVGAAIAVYAQDLAGSYYADVQ